MLEVSAKRIGKAVAMGVITLMLLTSGCGEKSAESAAMKRFKSTWRGLQDRVNEFYTTFKYSAAEGLGYEKGITRRDPSTVVKVGSRYYVWYTRTQKGPEPVGYDKATDVLPATTWDLASIYYATSVDSKSWNERGKAVGRGPKGAFDERSVFTPDILVAEGRYYLFYQAVGEPYNRRTKNVIAMSWADSPDGPWIRAPEPILRPGEPGEWLGEEDDRTKVKTSGAWDSHKVHDPILIVRNGKYWLYYKGHPMGGGGKDSELDIAWGVAIAEKPEGPYIKSKLNPVTNSGHEVVVWPYREGVAGLVTHNGHEKNTVQYAADGLNFCVKARVSVCPHAAGAYRPDAFTNTKWGGGITWGLCHIAQTPERPWAYIVRFDCDLSLKKDDPRFKRPAPRTGAETFFQKGNKLR